MAAASRTRTLLLLLLVLCGSVLLLAFAAGSEAKNFVGGGANVGCKVPAQPDTLNKWAEVNRFHVGDNLVFKFNGVVDSVLEVTLDDYNRCTTAAPVAAYKAGDATVPLPGSGPRFFVSGAPGSCEKGEHLIVVIMSEKHGRRSRLFTPVPAPAPPAPSPPAAGLVETPAPAPAPVTGAAAGRTDDTGAMVLGAAVAVARC